ncbi:hypothetical protein [Streptomyces evansiae]|uniref:hypothetical protein n=1 Tax=Streptomyces evansiae TaxID=3075535 RepID=UPI0028878581|nr:hypothetical protein [Streptomyces sp. DSM 41859]MDT0423521.1 hypothetical protein [Streptomyces sp. DSM 41859]
MVTRIPEVLLRHRIRIEPYLADTAYGPTYGPAIETVPALVDSSPRMARAPDGREFTAAATFIAAPDLDCPLGSRITLPDGRTATALTLARHTAPGLPVPACTEVSCE